MRTTASEQPPLNVASSNGNFVEPIAIIGFGFKFPQDITNAESLWKLLMERRSTMTEIPKNRWNIDGFYKEHGHRPGTVKNRGGHFLADDPARFDAPFFSIQPAEAECMDPQQRLLLETSYHALENAGIPMQSAMGTRTSVHVGCLLQEYSQISQRDAQMPGDYRIVGSSGLAMLANRLSWFYDFSGPSMTVDTACSGGLVALHLACQELLAGSVNMSLVCGNNLCLLPDSTALLSSLNMMSKDSVCYSFDERASGYARGEGFGVLILKRLSQAITDGDTIRGIVRSTGCGQDGNTPSITSPSQTAQERLIRETYARAGLSLHETRYFEAHGTGTPVGDPCEAAAINSVFSSRTPEEPMYVGALKSNMGHPEGASGIAGVIKTLLVLENGIIPPNVYPERINPAVTLAGPNLKFPLEPVVWPTNGVRRASVNSFGYGGTNAHVVIDDALSFLNEHGMQGRHCTRALQGIQEGCATDDTDESISREVLETKRKRRDSITSLGGSEDKSESVSANDTLSVGTEIDDENSRLCEAISPSPKLLVLSGFDERAVRRSIAALEHWMQDHIINDNRAQILDDLAYTLVEKRTSFPWKAVCVAPLESNTGLTWSTPVRARQRVDICFVFTGQGAQWHGMGRELLAYEVFRNSMLQADGYFRSLGSEWSLMDELYRKSREESAIHRPELSQPLCTALQVAIVDLLTSWKLSTRACIGHSSGEIAAAYASNVISRESAWMIAYFRGLAVAITQDITSFQGAMIAVQAPLDAWEHLMSKQNAEYPNNQVAIACYNSPKSFTVSGPHDAIHQLVATLKAAKLEVHVLHVNVAYHSHHMKQVAGVYGKLLRSIGSGQQNTEQPLFISTVTGDSLQQTDELRTSQYWNRNLTESVKFSTAVDAICKHRDASSYLFLEIGPHSALRSPLNDILKAHNKDILSDYASILRRDWSASVTTLECVGKLHTMGASIDIATVNNFSGPSPKFLTSLPGYQFEDKKKYWLEGRTSIQYRQTKFAHHELLGSRTPDWNEHEARWTNRILLEQSPYLKDHMINGMCLMPAAGMLVMAIEAVRQFYGDEAARASGYKLRDVTFTKAMTLSGEPRGTEIQFTLRPASLGRRDELPGSLWDRFSLYTYENEGWHLCCAGSISIDYNREATGLGHTVLAEKKQKMKVAVEQCRTEMDSGEIYGAFDQAGLAYGPTFQGLRNVKWDKHSQATGTIGLGDWEARARFAHSDAHFIHPAALDTILQMTFPAYSIYAKDASATTVPTGFSNAWFSSALADAFRSHQEVQVHAKVCGRGFRNKLFAVTAAFAECQDACFYGELETSTIGRSVASTRTQESNRSLYRIDWQPADFGNTTAPSELPATWASTVRVIFDDASQAQVHLARAVYESISPRHGLHVLVPWNRVAESDLANTTCVFLPCLDGAFLASLQEESLEKIKTLISTTKSLIWVTFQHHAMDQNPTEGLVSGLVRTLATESEDYRLVSLNLNQENGIDNASINIEKVVRALFHQQIDPEDEYCEVDGVLCTPRVIDDNELVKQALPAEQSISSVKKLWLELQTPKLTIGAAGILSTLHYKQTSDSEATLAPHDVIVAVRATGLNARDLLVALGQVHDEAFGSEIAGVVVRVGSLSGTRFQVGDRVFGVTRHGIAQTVCCKDFQLQKMPESMGFCAAAAFPVAFCTAYYALVDCARIKSSNSILIHHGVSTMGKAAIEIAKLHGCHNVFITVGSDEEATFLQRNYGVEKSHIFSMNISDWAQDIRRLTEERGMDIVLGNPEVLQQSWSCIAPFGRFIDVGEKDVFVSTANGSKEITIPSTTKNTNFTSLNFQELAHSPQFANIFEQVLLLVEDSKVTTTQPLAVFSQSDVEQAFRTLQENKMAGKVVIEMRTEELVEMEVTSNAPKPIFRADASYLVAGAFGGIGQSITRWMVENGAKHLILPSRSLVEGTDSTRLQFTNELRAQGAVVHTPVCDIADASQLESALASLSSMPQIAGCIQAAMSMHDSSFAKMTIAQWQKSLAPKVTGSWNLHTLLPDNLDFFVMLSSSTGIMGSFGQANYTAGNTYQDNLALHRMRNGQRAHTLALSMVTGVGYVAQNEQVQSLLRVRGMLEEVSLNDIYALLRFCCDPERVDASTIGPHIITPLTLPADLRALNIVAPLGSTRPIYHYLDTLPARIVPSSAVQNSTRQLLSSAVSLAQATDIVVSAIQTQLSSLLVVAKEDIDPQRAIYRYGVDSLVAVEMRNWFSKAVGADVATSEIMSDVSIWLLGVKVAGKSKFVPEAVREGT
ncbi:polyketide synthase [Pyrenophora seminiperda CCB06]|uniref:Polyketide synthase n=1 Tax=Pyrenophora seminiperda CCB06 TaxID=1302712 RepID=A0A3M7LW61_9PLEO|nr:polyketide synthase [Pyrenophora seminiperda CCB06]